MEAELDTKDFVKSNTDEHTLIRNQLLDDSKFPET